MKKTTTSFKRCILKAAAVTAVLAMLLSLTVPAFAEEAPAKNSYSQLLLLGDSITTGYGLQDYVSSDPYKCPSYGNKLAAALGLEAKNTYINRAVNGDRAADLLALMPSLKSTIAKSDLIVISIGGNELLQNIATIASAIAGKTVTSLTDAINSLMSADLAAYAAAAANAELQAQLASIISGYEVNLGKVVKLLKEYNPNARVVFLAQYNPLNKVQGIEAMNSFAAPILASINATMKKVVEEAGYEIADVPSVIDDYAAARTNILTMDIHPNAIGHDYIYKLLLDFLNIQDPAETTAEVTTEEITTEAATTAPETTAEPDTTAVPETTVAPETTAETPAKKGCGSFAAVAFISVLSGAALTLFKKK